MDTLREYANDQELLAAVPLHRNNFSWLSWQRDHTTNEKVIAEIDRYMLAAYWREERSAGMD